MRSNRRILFFCTILIGTIVAVLASSACDDKDGVFTGGASNKYQATTAKSVRVKSGQKLNAGIFARIDAGLDRLFEIAESKPNNYQVDNKHNAYDVWLFPRSLKCDNPAIITSIYAAEWDQHPDFDKDKRPGKTLICFAGMMFRGGNGTPQQTTPGMLVVDDAGVMETIVRYEGEHNVLLEEDYPRFLETIGPHQHPLLGDGNGLTAFVDERYEAFMIDLPRAVDAADGLRIEKGSRVCILVTK